MFFDQNNFFAGLKKCNIKTTFGIYKMSFDHKKFLAYLTEGKQLITARMYDGVKFLHNTIISPASTIRIRAEKISFFNAMKTVGFELRLGLVKLNKNGVEKQWAVDSKMRRDIIRLAKNDAYDTAIIISGDHHLIRAISIAKALEKNVEIYSFRSFIHKRLIRLVGSPHIYYFEGLLPLITNRSKPTENIRTPGYNYKRLAMFLIIKDRLFSKKKQKQ